MANRKGFTLIELLIVVVVIGILAAIAIPKFANTKEKAVKSSMISDLKNLATAQEAFYADSSHYATTYGTTIATGQVNVSPEPAEHAGHRRRLERERLGRHDFEPGLLAGLVRCVRRLDLLGLRHAGGGHPGRRSGLSLSP